MSTLQEIFIRDVIPRSIVARFPGYVDEVVDEFYNRLKQHYNDLASKDDRSDTIIDALVIICEPLLCPFMSRDTNCLNGALDGVTQLDTDQIESYFLAERTRRRGEFDAIAMLPALVNGWENGLTPLIQSYIRMS